ncbi:lipid-A-disaccharide synthase [Ferrovibrio sp.]|uniref:lipid-A-disaccharide synthase n=1 Tax=Ferrovibrio sp. TaxID=1917215 RepID=UPI0025C0E7F6|nr:lipid-A-disaccharide synthase [Ferrovibrio sp.]MBX3454401.1 lipid-A-disaccharide synthase [Ferrovibrio sp.]
MAEQALHIALVAGEPSGDALGEGLIRSLRQLHPGPLRFSGIGGERMQAEGFASLFPIAELAVMGLVEVLPRARRILQRLDQLATQLQSDPPDVLVTIDSPGFTHRLAKRLARRSFPIVHYVAPTVWAWRPGRAKTLAGLVDHLLTLLPFEPPYFEREGLSAEFVGHPAVETIAAARRVAAEETAAGNGFRQRFQIPAEAPLLAMLPGSRRGEVAKLLPVFSATIARLAEQHGNLHVVIPSVPDVAPMVLNVLPNLAVPARVVVAPAERYQAMLAADIALAASGTATLELGLAETPTVLAYRVNRITAAILRHMLKVPYAGLVNILDNREAMPEFLQEKCRPDNLAGALGRLLESPAVRAGQLAACRRVGAMLGLDETGKVQDPSPNHRAAAAVLAQAQKSQTSNKRSAP